MNKNTWLMPSLLAASIALTACGSDDDKKPTPKTGAEATIAGENVIIPTTYTFASQLEADTSAVSYTGQTARNAMISAMKSQIGSSELLNSADAKLDLDTAFGTEGLQVDLDNAAHGITSKGGFDVIPGPSYADISSGKNLVGKIAGNDKCSGVNALLLGQTDGIDSATADAHAAADCVWSPTEKGEAQQLIEHYFTKIQTGITAVNASTPAEIATTAGTAALPHYVDAQGRNYQQLTQKFLSVAIAFNQGTNDYLIGALTAAHTGDKDGAKPYTTAEHKWDEGFGYFGAARDYASYTDLQIKEGEVIDSNGDTKADLRSEINLNHSVNCAKRDYGMKDAEAADQTDFSKDAFTAFVEGRAILSYLAKANTDLSAEDFATLEDKLAPELEARAKTAALTWEKCIAATVVHYINDSVADIDATEAASYVFADGAAFETYAKHWSELKGFALGLQYNPNSPIYSKSTGETDYTAAMNLIGDAPKIDATMADYKTELLDARSKLQGIYDFTDYQVQNW
ncbi:MAG: DUF4856 domain-containing protein [Pseudomonadales bacterium]|nr:DUF4856 domain-containing protein [Pseudomonadales bacterium]